MAGDQSNGHRDSATRPCRSAATAIVRAPPKGRAKAERSGKIPYGLALAEDGHHLVEDGFEQSVIARVKALRAEGHAMTRIAKGARRARRAGAVGATMASAAGRADPQVAGGEREHAARPCEGVAGSDLSPPI
jgi:hypothetical protein